MAFLLGDLVAMLLGNLLWNLKQNFQPNLSFILFLPSFIQQTKRDVIDTEINVRASHPTEPGLILGIPKKLSLDVADIY